MDQRLIFLGITISVKVHLSSIQSESVSLVDILFYQQKSFGSKTPGKHNNMQTSALGFKSRQNLPLRSFFLLLFFTHGAKHPLTFDDFYI